MRDSESPKSQRKQLEQNIAALEAQRSSLGDVATDAAIASLRRELSQLQASAESHKEGERKVVTVLFSDVVGSTAMAEQMDPEEWTELMNAAFERLIEPVERYGGTVARLMGDAILAFFGAPIAHEDDPQRAVMAGLAIVENFEPFREEFRTMRDLDFNVRVGINTGLAVVGDVGSKTAGEYTAMGDAVNLAARMEQTAAPGTVQLSEDTYRLVAPLFEFEALGGVEVKGKAEPVQSYRAVKQQISPGRVRGIEGIESPLIGRQNEMGLLAGLIEALGQADSGAIVCLIGEAGLGKTRLIRELRDAADPAFRWREAASLSYESGQAYSLIQRLIRRMIDMAPGESTSHLSTQLGGLVQSFPTEEQEEVRRLFESLFGLDGQSGQPRLKGEAFRGRLFTVMTTLVEQQLHQGPLILVFDDLHWTDAASAALLQHLVPLVDRGSLLILLSMRPDTDSQGWKIRQAAEREYSHRFTDVQLRPLSAKEGSQLVDNLLAISDLPVRLRELIQDKTEGNPFFVEEVVRTLIDEGMVVRDATGARWRAEVEAHGINIPDNVQALLAARIDRLSEDVRRALQLAAVVGRSFYYRVLARVVDAVDGLEAQLLTLQRAQFIAESAREPELEYIFRHALTQEAAYSAILLRHRREYHRRVGETMESLFSGREEEFASALAFHFFQADDFERALTHYTTAGDVSYRLFAITEAIDQYSWAISCAAKVDSVTGEQLAHLYTRRGRAYELENRFEEAMDDYETMIELAQERDDKALRLASLTAQCIVHATGTPLLDPPRAEALAEEALSLAGELGDRATEARLYFGLLILAFYGGREPSLALEDGRRSLEIARELGLTEQVGYTLHGIAGTLMFHERYEDAKQANLEERAAWQEVSNTPMLADSYLLRGGISLNLGDFHDTVAAAEEALRISRSIGHRLDPVGVTHPQSIPTVTRYYVGLANLARGDIGQAQENLHRGVRITEREGNALYKYAGHAHLILLYMSMGALDRAEPLAEEFYQVRDQIFYGFYSLGMSRVARLKLAQGDLPQAQKIQAESIQEVDWDNAPIWFMADVMMTEALLHLAQSQPMQALQTANQFVDRCRQAGTKGHLTDALLVKGKALTAIGEHEQARDALLEAAEVAGSIRHRGLLWQILAALSEIEMKVGNADAAQDAQRRARELVDYIAERAGDDELKNSFLALPEMRSVLAD